MKNSEDSYSQIRSIFGLWWKIIGAVITALILPVLIHSYLKINEQIEQNIFSGPQNQIERFQDVIINIATEHNLWYAFILSVLVILTTFMIISMVYKLRLSLDRSVCKATLWYHFIPVLVNSLFLLIIAYIGYHSLDADYKIGKIKYGIGLPSFLLPYVALLFLHNSGKEKPKKIFIILAWSFLSLWVLWIGYILLKTFGIIPSVVGMADIVIIILWAWVVPLGIGAIVYNLRRRKLLGIIAMLLAIFACTSPFWTLKLFNWLGPSRETLRSNVYTFLSLLFFLIVIGCIVAQMLVIKSHIKQRIVEAGSKIAGLFFIFSYSIYVSATKVGNGFDYLYEALIERSRPLTDLITIVLTASGEGLEVLLLFLLAFVSGYLVYPLMNNRKFFKRSPVILVMLVGWLIVVSVNEAFIQKLWTSGRDWDFLDILHNMVGVLIGLILSIRWFCKREPLKINNS